MFKLTPTSQAKGPEYLGRFMAREVDRDPPSSLATIEAQYDAVVEWGIPDYGKLHRLAAIKQPTFVANGDGDLMLPPRLSHLMAGLFPTRRSRSIRIPLTASCGSTTRSSAGTWMASLGLVRGPSRRRSDGLASRPDAVSTGQTLRRYPMKKLLIAFALIVASAAPVMAEGFPNPDETNR